MRLKQKKTKQIKKAWHAAWLLETSSSVAGLPSTPCPRASFTPHLPAAGSKGLGRFGGSPLLAQRSPVKKEERGRGGFPFLFCSLFPPTSFSPCSDPGRCCPRPPPTRSLHSEPPKLAPGVFAITPRKESRSRLSPSLAEAEAAEPRKLPHKTDFGVVVCNVLFCFVFIMMMMMIYFGHLGRSAESVPVVQAGRRGRREVVWEMEVGIDLFFAVAPPPSERNIKLQKPIHRLLGLLHLSVCPLKLPLSLKINR